MVVDDILALGYQVLVVLSELVERKMRKVPNHVKHWHMPRHQ